MGKKESKALTMAKNKASHASSTSATAKQGITKSHYTSPTGVATAMAAIALCPVIRFRAALGLMNDCKMVRALFSEPDDEKNPEGNFSYYADRIKAFVLQYTTDLWPFKLENPHLVMTLPKRKGNQRKEDVLYVLDIHWAEEKPAEPIDLEPLFSMRLRFSKEGVHPIWVKDNKSLTPVNMVPTQTAQLARRADKVRRQKQIRGSTSILETASRAVRQVVPCIPPPPIKLNRTFSMDIDKELRTEQAVDELRMQRLTLEGPTPCVLGQPLLEGHVTETSVVGVPPTAGPVLLTVLGPPPLTRTDRPEFYVPPSTSDAGGMHY